MKKQIVKKIAPVSEEDCLKHIPHDHGCDTEELLKFLPAEKEFVEAADLFSQLCDSTRLRILWLLCHSEECVGDIAAAVDMSAPAVSHHLRVLRQAGLISSRREGKEVLYTLQETKEAELVHQMIDGVFAMKCPGRKHKDKKQEKDTLM